MKEPRQKIWLLTNWPNPYQMDLLRAIGRRSEVELSVRFMRSYGDMDRQSLQNEVSFDAKIMSGWLPRWVRDELNWHPRALLNCLFGKFHCFVLSGTYTSLTFLTCAIVLALRGKPVVLWLERPHPRRSNARWASRIASCWPVRFVRQFILRMLFRWSRRVFCIGQAAADDYESMGVTPENLRVLPYCLDVNRFQDFDPSDVDQIDSKLDLAGRTVFLFSGQLIERKGVDTAIAAFAKLADQRPDVALVLLGDGPLRQQLRSSVPPHLHSRIHFVGHVAQPDLPAFYRAADVFVFPSRHDGWAVVMNEACAAELPIISTKQTGASRELVENGQSGFVLERDAIDRFFQAMKFFVDEPDQIKAFGRRSRQLVEQYSAENSAALFIQHINEVTGRPTTVPVDMAVTAK